MKARALLLVLALGTITFSIGNSTFARGALPSVDVTGPRLRVLDVLPLLGLDGDLGAVPAPGASRVVTRDEVEDAIRKAGGKVPKKLPEAIRVVRKMRRLTPADVERIARDGAAETPMPRGTTLASVHAESSRDVPEGWDHAFVEIPKPPRRAGRHPATALVVLRREGEELQRFHVPIELAFDPAAALPDVSRGASVTLLVERGLIEVSTDATASADGDIGEIIPVTTRSSGRIVKAKIIAPGRVTSVESR